MSTFEERLTSLEVEVELLKKPGKCASPHARLLVVVEKTIERMEIFEQDKRDQIESGDADDYADVVSTLPALRRAFAEAKKDKP